MNWYVKCVLCASTFKHSSLTTWWIKRIKDIRNFEFHCMKRCKRAVKVNRLSSATKLLFAFCIFRICNGLMPQALKMQFSFWIMDNGLSNAFMQTPTDTIMINIRTAMGKCIFYCKRFWIDEMHSRSSVISMKFERSVIKIYFTVINRCAKRKPNIFTLHHECIRPKAAPESRGRIKFVNGVWWNWYRNNILLMVKWSSGMHGMLGRAGWERWMKNHLKIPKCNRMLNKLTILQWVFGMHRKQRGDVCAPN